jgi:acetylornithine aminotransferase
MRAPPEPFASRDEAFSAFAEHVSPGKAAFYREVGFDVVMGAREGARFFDAYGGKAYWNCHANGGVFNLGHRHPAVVAAVREALETLDIGNHHLVSGRRATLAARLSRSTGDRLPGVIFGVAGGEAADVAIKAARAATGRRGVVSAVGGYHGHTGLAILAGDAQYRAPFGLASEDFAQVPFDDDEALELAVGRHTAAVILESIPATLGMPLPSPGYFARVEAVCRARGAKLIVDEVQTGLARTGRMWGYQHEGIAPDALITGKGLSGGVYPIAATLLSEELFAVFAERPFVHVSTFGGAELGCAAATAVLDVVEAPGFLARVESLSERFAAGLAGLGFTLRRRGLMMALKFPMPEAGLFASKHLYDRGVFAVYANHDTSCVQLLPPLVLSDDEADAIIAAIRGAFS